MASSKKRLDLSDEENEEDKFKINQDFSERYERYRSKEVLQQLKDKYGDQIWQSDEESDQQSNSEDDDSDESSELEESDLFDEKFLRVLGALKSKDKTIYDRKSVFYTKDDVIDLDKNKEARKLAKQQIKEQPAEKMNLADYHKKLIKEKKGLTAEDEQMADEQEQPHTNLTYYQELSKLKQDLLQAAGDEEEQDEIIVGKKVIEFSDDESTVSKRDAKTILETKSKDDKFIKKLNKYWKSDELNKNEQFLRDFIINKAYLSDHAESNDEEPSSKSKEYLKEEERSEDEYDSDDSTHRKLVKTYESTRFHHQEPDADKIKSFPRQIESIRDIALKRKKGDKRAELKERKKQQKEAELRKLRELKRSEIRHKINLLEKTTGTKLTSKLQEIDIDTLVDDTDFDAEKYDQKMSELFNDEYYGIDEQDDKPKFEYDSEIDDAKYYDELDQDLVADEDDYKGEIVDFDNQEADNINEFDEDELNEEQLSKKQKKRLKQKEKSDKKKKDKLKNQNFGIYEDVIDGQGVRFRYRKTQATNYGLTDEEILLADEKELNRWVSLRKSQQYDDDEQDIEKYNRKGKNFRLKRKILKSIYASSDEEEYKDRYQNAGHQDEPHNEPNAEQNEDEPTTLSDNLSNKKRKKKNRRKRDKKPKVLEQES